MRCRIAPASSQLQGMQRILLSHACTADVVLDLHCDAEAALHMYACRSTGRSGVRWPRT
jgi:predicted deacylase